VCALAIVARQAFTQDSLPGRVEVETRYVRGFVQVVLDDTATEALSMETGRPNLDSDRAAPEPAVEPITPDVRREGTMLIPVRLWLLAGALSMCSACSPAPSAPPSTPNAPPLTTASPTPNATLATRSATRTLIRDSASGITFEHPSSWVVWQPNQHVPWTGGPLVYLATDPLLTTCAVAPGASPNPPDANGSACTWPLDGLEPGGVLVEWFASRLLGPMPTTGPVVEANGAKARWLVSTPGSCSEIKADETITVLVPIGQPSPLSNIFFVACLRGPDLAGSEAAVRALLESARIGP